MPPRYFRNVGLRLTPEHVDVIGLNGDAQGQRANAHSDDTEPMVGEGRAITRRRHDGVSSARHLLRVNRARAVCTKNRRAQQA